jgi:hypothetical protein
MHASYIVDGCFINTRYICELLILVGIDSNYYIFPVASAALEMEDNAN